MKRVIIELNASQQQRRSLEAGDPGYDVEGLDLPGVTIDKSFGAQPLDSGALQSEQALSDVGLRSALTKVKSETVIVRGTLDVDEEDEDAIADAKAKIEKNSAVAHVWDDGLVMAFGDCGCGDRGSGATEALDMSGDLPSMEEVIGDVMPFADDGSSHHAMVSDFAVAAASPCPPTDCQYSVAKGTISDVAKYLNCHRLWNKGIRGQGVAVGVVDTGVDKTKVANVVDGWTPNAAYPWGTDPGGHGSMCATDVLGMAPDAQIYDIGLLKSQGNMTAFLSDAIVAFQWAINKYRASGKPQILSNSWGMYQKSWAPDYCTDPNHPFTRKVVEAINTGMIVTFAAGNCGEVCPSGRCGSDNGPGKSIWGANGHPRSITVGAANIREEWIGYTSQGPAALDPRKPDFVAPSHFKGYTASDNGTSAANPVCAGVIALLRGHDAKLRQDKAKEALQKTAKDLCGNGWDRNSGYGMINAERAFNYLNLFQTPLIHASWTHGHSVHVERPDLLDENRPFGFYSLIRGKPNTSNWFHFAVPTPVIVSGRRLALDSVMVLFWTDPSVHVHALHVWDANRPLIRYNGLNFSGSHWFERFDVLNNRVQFGIGVSVGVRFGGGDDLRRILFGSCGGDFVS